MSRKRQNVLDEDTYLRAIDTLVERQFFPDNELLALENAYYEAEAQNDLETMKNLTIRRRELQEQKTPFSQIRSGRKDKDNFMPATPGGSVSGRTNPEGFTGSLRGDFNKDNKVPGLDDDEDLIKKEENLKTEAEEQEEELRKHQEELDALESEDYLVNPTITLNGFLNTNTSEDNHQYHQVQRNIDQKKHLAKYRWVYELDNKHRKTVPYATADAGLGIAAKRKLKEQQEQLALEYQLIEKEKQLPLIPVGEAKEKDVPDVDKKDEEGNEKPVIKNNKVVRQDESLYQPDTDRDASKIINNWRYISKNNVMFFRDAIGSKYDDGKFKKPMQINYEATRFKEKDPYAKQMERMRIEKASQKAQMFKAGQVQKDGSSVNQDGSWTPGDGRFSSTGTPGRTPARITPGLSTNTPLGVTKFGAVGATPLTVKHNSLGGTAGGATPAGSVTGSDAGFVPNTPSITPGVGPDASPLMTWGTLGTTPIALTPKLGEEGDSGSRYKFPGVLKRELVAEKLLEKVKSRDREKKSKVMEKAKKSIFGDTPDRLGSVLGGSTTVRSLTPTARALASKTGGIGGFGKSSSRRGAATPMVRLTNKRKPIATPTPAVNNSSMIAAKLSKLNNKKGVTGGLL